jgi:hypothetical protein
MFNQEKRFTKLLPMPRIVAKSALALTAQQHEQFRTWVHDLAAVRRQFDGLSSTLFSQVFAPINHSQVTVLTTLPDKRGETPEAFRRLVEHGPEAMPILLEHLEDQKPSRLTIELKQGVILYVATIDTNPENVFEERALSLLTSRRPDEPEGTAKYVVTVGDLCFAALGQITGRAYSPVHYVPTATVSITSPTHKPSLVRFLRAVWESKNPRQHLLNSLLLDYSTRGLCPGQPADCFDVWKDGCIYQAPAMMRMLYYYPEECEDLILRRLASLDVRKPPSPERLAEREVHNGYFTRLWALVR